jgi:hypothetical protein
MCNRLFGMLVEQESAPGRVVAKASALVAMVAALHRAAVERGIRIDEEAKLPGLRQADLDWT